MPRSEEFRSDFKSILEAFLDIASTLEKEIAGFLGQHVGLSLAQFKVIEAIGTKGEIPLSQISRELGCTKGNITGMVDRLERDGYLVRKRNEEDRRIVAATLTDQGLQVFALKDRFDAFIAQREEQLFGDNKQDVARFLEQIADRLQYRVSIPSQPAEVSDAEISVTQISDLVDEPDRKYQLERRPTRPTLTSKKDEVAPVSLDVPPASVVVSHERPRLVIVSKNRPAD